MEFNAYSFLSNFTSLIEVLTAIYVSMFIDNILVQVWTPAYKESITKMIDDMKIPGVGLISNKLGDNIQANSDEIKNHMRRKASFFIVVCLSLLLIAGIEPHSSVLPVQGYRLVFALSLVAMVLLVLGRWTFSKPYRVVGSIFTYIAVMAICYFTPLFRMVPNMSIASEKSAMCIMLTVLLLPILWQLFLIWIYSSLYKGYMRNRIAKESYLFGRAFIAYRLRSMSALPEEYQLAARAFITPPSANQDNSLEGLTSIITGRLEELCVPPRPLVIIFSWLKHKLHIDKEKELEYIQINGLDYAAEVHERGSGVLE